jgi:hypothetical protein
MYITVAAHLTTHDSVHYYGNMLTTSYRVPYTCMYTCNNPLCLVRFMVFNATFNNISVISWRSVLLVEEIGVPGENHRPATSH